MLGALSVLGEGQKSESASGHARGRGGLGTVKKKRPPSGGLDIYHYRGALFKGPRSACTSDANGNQRRKRSEVLRPPVLPQPVRRVRLRPALCKADILHTAHGKSLDHIHPQHWHR